jgi:hypothetical protein
MSRTDALPSGIPRRTCPLVWVKRLVLFKSLDPPERIREIPFTTGLNIIQGESNESDEAFQTGHGIGKTTVCRLVRYCLGEKSYGQKHVTDEVKNCFPDAYAGAVVVLDGTEWAVLRPLGSRTREYASEGSSFEDLLQAQGARRYYSFIERLSSLALANLPVDDALTGGQALQWVHVLAMCSRDQESRYDRFWNWRHPRSESGTPRFGKPKVDAGLCVRLILGLLDPAESNLRKRLEGLETTLERMNADIRRKREEPAFHVTGLRNALVNQYGVVEAGDAPVDGSLVGLRTVTEGRLTALREEVARIDEELIPLNRQISITAAAMLEPAELAEQLEAASEVTNEGNDALLAELEQWRAIRQLLRDVESSPCRYGRIAIGECSYVVARAGQLDGEIRDRQRVTLPTVSEREQAATRLAEQASRQRSLIQQTRQRLDGLNRQKDELVERRRNLNDQIRRIPAVLSELHDWTNILEGRKPNTTLRLLETEAEKAASILESTKRELARLITGQAERAKRLGNRFDSVVRQTLTNDFRGVVEVAEDGIDFRIVRGESLSGEAYETLAIILADVALLLEGNAAHSRHPGLLIHDSPREADLYLGIYQRLLDLADAEMRGAAQDADIPFQYIVTTTTPPSKRLQNKSITKLKLSSGPGSLFGRQLETAKPLSDQRDLFETTEDT